MIFTNCAYLRYLKFSDATRNKIPESKPTKETKLSFNFFQFSRLAKFLRLTGENRKRTRPDHRPTQKAISGRREIESVYFVVDYRFPMALSGRRARFGDVFSQLRRMQMRNDAQGPGGRTWRELQTSIKVTNRLESANLIAPVARQLKKKNEPAKRN